MSRLVKVKLALVDADHYIATENVDDGTHQWERKLLGVSGFSRSVSIDRSFERGGFTLDIDDTDGAFKAMMADGTNRKIHGKVVTVYAYKQDGATLAETITATIKSFKLGDNVFTLDCAQEFAGKMASLPTAIDLKITLADWPNASSHSVGKRVPMPSGIINTARGGSKAFRVNSTVGGGLTDSNVQFVVTWSDPGGAAKVISCDEVFNAGWKLAGSSWSFARDVNGWELITFATMRKPVPWLISCNLHCTTPLSASGNPVPHLRDILSDAGVTLLDDGDGGTSDFEDFCTTNSWSIYGVIPDNIETIQEYLETWCHNFDCFWRIDAAGVVHIRHIDWDTVAADVTLTERHFEQLAETDSNDEFANRINANFNYDSRESEWVNALIQDSTDGDILPATTPIEIADEYAFFSYTVGGSTPLPGKLKYIDKPVYTISAIMDLHLYETLGVDLLRVADITHSNQIGSQGKYLVMRETRDYSACTVSFEARRLWGV